MRRAVRGVQQRGGRSREKPGKEAPKVEEKRPDLMRACMAKSRWEGARGACMVRRKTEDRPTLAR